ncbi:MAG: nickel-dependent lactate racemase [Deltaproteobacteria bacterium]|nr:nickel-dependent lactate racemase [Deltaproteobacteria bacterium]
MAFRSFSLRYGRSNVSFELPEDQISTVITGREVKAIDNLEEAYLHALDHPIDSAPLRYMVKPGETVAIAVSDITRVWQKNDQTLPLLLNYLNDAGIPDENIRVIIAVGGHRQNTDAEFQEICGSDVCHRVRVVNHQSWETEDMVPIGRTSRGTQVSINKIAASADRILLTGGVVYHYMVGYGGGRKSVIPGICSLDTIKQNHLWVLGQKVGAGTNPLCASGSTADNPLHEDMMEIAALVRPDFLINIVPNLAGEIAGIFAGNWASAWWKATRMVDDIFGVPIEEESDIVIATAGGYPKDINLYQSQKTIDNAWHAMKPNGVAIILAECPDIREPKEFFDWFEHRDRLEMEKALRANYVLAGWLAFHQFEYRDKGLIILVTREENFRHAEKAQLYPVASIEEALRVSYSHCGTPKPRITVMPQGANTLPLLKKRYA